VIPESKFVDTYFFETQIEEEINTVKLNLASGACTSYDDYKYVVGIVEGLEKAKAILKNIANKYQEKEE
tara:strand:+ start:333 stop:539 length:207 start_codon:yes stop_codon:yes gene_type:complete